MPHPDTARDDTVETLHGTPVPDPYRWMEDQTSAEVADWVKRQAEYSRDWLGALPHRDAIAAQLAAVWDHPKVGVPWCRGSTWLQHRNSGMQQQAVVWAADSPTAEGRVLLDPADLSEDGTVSLAGVSVTADGSRLAYGTSDGGSDWITWHVRDVATGVDTDDRATWGKFSGAAWTHDGAGFFYGAYDAPEPGQEMSQRNDNHQLRYHRVGGEDPVTVMVRPDQPSWGFSPQVSEDGRWLIITVWEGTQPTNRLYLGDLSTVTDPAEVQIRPWLDAADAEYGVIATRGDKLYVQTDADAPNGRLLAIDAADPSQRTEILAGGPHALAAVRMVGGGPDAGRSSGDARLIVVRMVDAVHRLTVHSMDGVEVARIPLPDLASVGGITGRQSDDVAHLSLSSFVSSGAIHRLDLTGEPTLTEVRPATIHLPDVVTEQVMVDSTNSARVPLFLIRPADAPRDGTNRTILYGYGGFNIPLSPEFRLWWSVWLARGGSIAVGCYRGGGEYGRDWHDAGRLAQKMHTIDDAIACARWLAGDPNGEAWASPDNIAITGGSNGGLTAAAAMLRAPEAFGACVPEVGVLDLLRFHRFTIGWGWTSDYGDPDDLADFPLIHKLSPYHTALDTPGRYPATLVVTADRDDRVVPAHSFKFTAALQAAQTGQAPILARIDTRAGHGAGTPTSKQIESRADVMAFLEQVLPGAGYTGRDGS